VTPAQMSAFDPKRTLAWAGSYPSLVFPAEEKVHVVGRQGIALITPMDQIPSLEVATKLPLVLDRSVKAAQVGR